MAKHTYSFQYEVYSSINEMNADDAFLLKEAIRATDLAYAPYSDFHVGAAARLNNGEIILGSNQENASYPVGLCAERGLIATAATLHPNVGIETLAISYDNIKGESNHPISPCGMCRQALLEFEDRGGNSMRIILGGKEGNVYVLESATMLLPLSFGSSDLK